MDETLASHSVPLDDAESSRHAGAVRKAGILCVCIPFEALDDFRSAGLLKNSGSYLVVGTTAKENGQVLPAAYVGKASTRRTGSGCFGRLLDHCRSLPARLEHPTHALVFTRCPNSSRNVFNAAQVACLEMILVGRIKNGKRFELVNRQNPSNGDLGKKARAKMEVLGESAVRLAALFGFPFAGRDLVPEVAGPPAEATVAWFPQTEEPDAGKVSRRPE